MMIIPASVDSGVVRALETFRRQLECEGRGAEGSDDGGEAEGLKMEAGDKGHGDDAGGAVFPTKKDTESGHTDDD